MRLDPMDINLLKEIQDFGEAAPAVLGQGHRLEQLKLEGYVTSVRRDLPELDTPPRWVYKFTIKVV
jgi:hypothetical protein